MHAVHVRLLGALQVDVDTTRHERLPSRAVTALLARLALEPDRAHPREELIELLWPGVDLQVGRNRLRQALSTLKSLLESGRAGAQRPVLQADRLQVRVVAGSLACDVGEFERAVRRRERSRAVELYRGELLPGHYDEWICTERMRLDALHDRVLAIPDEPRSAEAPDTPPALAASLPVAPTVAADDARLPSYLTRMYGADEQARELRGVVIAHRLVTLLGPGGIGKTRLAVEVAHSLRPHAGWPVAAAEPPQSFDPIVHVPLVACTQRSQFVDALTAGLRIAAGPAAPLDAAVTALHGRHALLVLDNFEQLVGQAEDLVARLLAQLPGLHLLVTSRRPLGLDGERELLLPPIELPPAGAGLAEAAANPAVALFVDRARAVRADFHLAARNAGTLVALVRALQGLPLAVELAAARVRSVAPAEMLLRLQAPGAPQLELLARSGTARTPDPRHLSMQQTIRWSWDQLDDAQRRLLGACTVFARPFTAGAAEVLAEGQALDARRRLDELVAHSMVQALPAPQAFRFAIYEPIREFALVQMSAHERRHWRAGLLRWAGTWVDALPSTPPLPELHAEMPNLVAALAGAATDAAWAEGAALLARLRRCLEVVDIPAEGLVHARHLVEHCPDPVASARGHSLLGTLLMRAGDGAAALRHAELGVQRDLLDPADTARALHALARVRWRSRRRAAEVEPLLDEAQRLLRPDADPDLAASLLSLRAFVRAAHHKDAAGCARLLEQALVLWQRTGNRHAVHSGQYNLAVGEENARQSSRAVARLDPLIAGARALQDWQRLSQSLNVRGNAHADLRDWRRALDDYRECVAVAWQALSPWDLAFGLWNLPRTLLHLRQPEPAVRLAAFADAFWRDRFGELSADDLRALLRVRRLALHQVTPARYDALWRDGAVLSLAQAVEIALVPHPPNTLH